MQSPRRISGAYAALVTAPDFKSGVALERGRGGFDSHPLPLNLLESVLPERVLASRVVANTVEKRAELIRVRHGFVKCSECGKRGERGPP